MNHSCCNHKHNPTQSGFQKHDIKCDQVAETAVQTKESTTKKKETSDSGGSDDESDCCHITIDHDHTSNHQHTHTDGQLRVNKQLDNSPLHKRYIVNGIDCSSCAASIEKTLLKEEKIDEAIVHFSTGKLSVGAQEENAFQSVESIVRKLGYDIQPEVKDTNEQIYEVIGMDCSSCAASIEKHIQNFPQVETASIHFSTGVLTAKHTGKSEAIIKEIQNLGYEAHLKSSKQQTKNNKSKFKSYNSIIFSGLFIAIGFALRYTSSPTYIETILFAIAMITTGIKPVKSAWFAVKNKSLDMNVLMSSAAIGAAFIGEWFEGATVVFLFSLGNALQTSSMEKTRNSIRGLMDLAPSEAWVLQGTDLVKKPAEDILIGESIVVKPGDRIPLDGNITDGTTSINEAPITGESIPSDKTIDDTVFAGTINQNGSITIQVIRHAEDTTIARIIHQVEEAQEQRAPTQAFIDRFSQYYTPIVFTLAISLIVFPPLFGIGSWNEWFYRGLALLIVACPCALVISTPVAIVSAIGNAARNGVLIKGGTFLEKAGIIDSIAFDKTGTLTEGTPQVTDVFPFEVTKEELLTIGATLENHSTHPIAKTIVDYAKDVGIKPLLGADSKNIVGKGVRAQIDRVTYYAGSLALFEELEVNVADHHNRIIEEQNNGKTIIIIGTKTNILGMIAVADTLRSSSVRALKQLKHIGVQHLAMLTGDNQGTAKKIAEETEINRYFAELMPEEKVAVIKTLQNEGYHVAMVGDGINDAPALATAELGIAMGGAGTDTAMETADIVLMADNLEKLPHTMQLGKRALTIIKQNIWFSILIKLIALLLIFPGWLTLWLAVLSDTGAAVIVVLNALRLLRVKA